MTPRPPKEMLSNPNNPCPFTNPLLYLEIEDEHEDLIGPGLSIDVNGQVDLYIDEAGNETELMQEIRRVLVARKLYVVKVSTTTGYPYYMLRNGVLYRRLRLNELRPDPITCYPLIELDKYLQGEEVESVSMEDDVGRLRQYTWEEVRPLLDRKLEIRFGKEDKIFHVMIWTATRVIWVYEDDMGYMEIRHVRRHPENRG